MVSDGAGSGFGQSRASLATVTLAPRPFSKPNQDLWCVTYPLSSLSSLSFLPPSLNPSSAHRNAQVTACANNARLLALNQKIFHLPDGPVQRAWDEAMRAAMAAELDDDEGGGKPPISTDGEPELESRIQFGYNAYSEVERWWSASGREYIEALAGDGDCGANRDRAGTMVKARF